MSYSIPTVWLWLACCVVALLLCAAVKYLEDR